MLRRANSNTNFGEYEKTLMKLQASVIANKQMPEIIGKIKTAGLNVPITELDRYTKGANLKIEGNEAISECIKLKDSFKNTYGDIYVSASKQAAEADINKTFPSSRR